MSADRISHAMDRIDRALARIETQAALARHPQTQPDSGESGLAARHEALRQSVSASLSELDALIERLAR